MKARPLWLLLAGWALGCAAGAVPMRDSGPPFSGDHAASLAPAESRDTVDEPAETLFRASRYREAARAFLALPPGDRTARATERVAAAVSRLGRHAVEELAGMADSGYVRFRDPRFGAVAAELALRFALSGEAEASQRYAAQARAAGADALHAQVAPPVVGVVLPLTGRPRDQEYADLFLEGVQVGVALARRGGLAVELVVEDGRGTAYGSAQAASALAARGVAAVLGPLAGDNLTAVADVLPDDVPLFSPIARLLPPGRLGVHSLAAGGPSAARTLAAALSGLGYVDALVVHSRSPARSMEAAAFLDEFAGAGGFARRIAYEPGTTTFEEPLREAGLMAPELLVVLAPPEDLLLLAPQISFFELDDTDIQVAGTAGWTDPRVLEEVDRRHTDHVVAVSAVPPGSTSERSAEFTAAYEDHLQKALRSPVPAAGFDLLRIALATWAERARTGAGPAAALAGLHRFEGATGAYSAAGGSLTKEFFPVRLLDGAVHPLEPQEAGVVPAAAGPGASAPVGR